MLCFYGGGSSRSKGEDGVGVSDLISIALTVVGMRDKAALRCYASYHLCE